MKLQQKLNDQVYRSAEISNIENAKERQDAAKYRSQSLAQNLLNVIDNLERATFQVNQKKLKTLKRGWDGGEGFYAFKEEGIEEIDALNQPLILLHHVLFKTVPVEEGQEADRVVLYQKGYKLKDRVLHHQWSLSHNKKTKLKNNIINNRSGN